jgi:pimeloyl-ACP methyl ester carboxylesterase
MHEHRALARLQAGPSGRAPARAHPLIVWGTSDRIYDIAGADRLHRRLPGSAVHRLPRPGHHLLIENAPEAASIYLGFLRARVTR